MVAWRLLPLEGKLDYMMPQASSSHSWTCSCASVADAPVLMWARLLIPCGVPIWSTVLQWKRLQDAGWGALGAPRPIAYYADRPATVTPVPGYCCVSDIAHAMAHVADARAGAGPGRAPCISITPFALARCQAESIRPGTEGSCQQQVCTTCRKSRASDK